MHVIIMKGFPIIWLPDNCAPYVIIYTGAQLSGSRAPLCMYCSSIYESDQGLVAAGYSIYNIYYRYSNESKT